MPHSKKTIVLKMNDGNTTERKPTLRQNQKEAQTNAQANSQLNHIYFCPNLTTTTLKV
jgi:hypothetical protein